MATWTDPKTWAVGEALTASDLNVELRDNLDALKEPPTDSYLCDEDSDYTTTSTTFVDVDGANSELTLSITTTGGYVLVGFYGYAKNSALGGNVYFDVSMNGTMLGGDDGLIVSKAPVANYGQGISFVHLSTKSDGSRLDADTYTFVLKWKVSSGTGTLSASDDINGGYMHPQFWVREV